MEKWEDSDSELVLCEGTVLAPSVGDRVDEGEAVSDLGREGN